MRISDWSSDVCSSDLDSYAKRQSPRKRAFRVCPAPLQAHLREGRRAGRNPQARVLREADPGAQVQGRRRREASGAPHLDRKSVVEGKSVSVRVDLGGRRIIKKKKQTKIEQMSQLKQATNQQTPQYPHQKQ